MVHVSRAARTKVEKALVGPAGEHYVLYQLYRHGLLASLAPPGTPVVDVLVLASDQSVVATVQVKTRTYGADGGWHMSEKHERIVEPRCFYASSNLEPDSPATFVVPSAVVADVLGIAHRAWLATPGRGGRAHRDHTMRGSCSATPSRSPAIPQDGSTATATADFSAAPSILPTPDPVHSDA